MATYDNYNRSYHKGNLPVRVLPDNYIDWFLNITPDFKAEIDYEVDSNEFKKYIIWNIDKTSITTNAFINTKHEIELFENYCQFLWNCSYAFFVIFDEGIQKKSIAGTFDGNYLDTSNHYIKNAVDLFKSGLSLFQTYSQDVFFTLPNPEKYNDFEKYYIEKANGVYTAAMTFTLLHEFGHQYYGHVTTYSDDDQSKKDEYLADDFAFDRISTRFESKEGITYKFGILVGICSLIFIDSTLKGGDKHPDPDHRLKNMIEKMDLPDLDNLWALASLPFILWGNYFNKPLAFPKVVDNYKELFDETMNQLDAKKGYC